MVMDGESINSITKIKDNKFLVSSNSHGVKLLTVRTNGQYLIKENDKFHFAKGMDVFSVVSI